VSLTDADLVARILLDDDHHAFSELVRRQSAVPVAASAYPHRHRMAMISGETFVKSYKNISFEAKRVFPGSIGSAQLLP
jgi:hypothetical protein